MADDDEQLGPNDIDIAIQRAAAKSPKLAKARDKLDQMVGGLDKDEGYRMLAQALRRMMRQE
jgi:hypothetical protein